MLARNRGEALDQDIEALLRRETPERNDPLHVAVRARRIAVAKANRIGNDMNRNAEARSCP